MLSVCSRGADGGQKGTKLDHDTALGCVGLIMDNHSANAVATTMNRDGEVTSRQTVHGIYKKLSHACATDHEFLCRIAWAHAFEWQEELRDFYEDLMLPESKERLFQCVVNCPSATTFSSSDAEKWMSRQQDYSLCTASYDQTRLATNREATVATGAMLKPLYCSDCCHPWASDELAMLTAGLAGVMRGFSREKFIRELYPKILHVMSCLIANMEWDEVDGEDLVDNDDNPLTYGYVKMAVVAEMIDTGMEYLISEGKSL